MIGLQEAGKVDEWRVGPGEIWEGVCSSWAVPDEHKRTLGDTGAVMAPNANLGNIYKGSDWQCQRLELFISVMFFSNTDINIHIKFICRLSSKMPQHILPDLNYNQGWDVQEPEFDS